MEPLEINQLVSLATGGPALDAIVAGLPSDAKAMVAVVEDGRGPVIRSVARSDLTPREAEGSADPALRALIRRTAHSAGGGRTAGASAVQGRRGFGKSTGHRTTGK